MTFLISEMDQIKIPQFDNVGAASRPLLLNPDMGSSQFAAHPATTLS